MSSKKGTGSTKNGRDSNPKFLGCKLYGGEHVKAGMIIYRQRGNKVWPGENVGQGKDHTLFALTDGIVKYSTFEKYKTKVQVVNPSVTHEFVPNAVETTNKVETPITHPSGIKRHNHVSHSNGESKKIELEKLLKVVKSNPDKRVELKPSDSPIQIIARTNDGYLVTKGGQEIKYSDVVKQITENTNKFFVDKKKITLVSVHDNNGNNSLKIELN